MKRPDDPHASADGRQGQGWPRRWQQEGHGLGSIMRGYVRRLESGDDEAAAFVRARAAHRRNQLERRVLGASFVTAAGAAVVWILIAGRSRVEVPVIAPPQNAVATRTGAPTEPRLLPTPTGAVAARVAQTQTQTPTPARTLRLGARPVRLAAGNTALRGEAMVVLAKNAEASTWRRGTKTMVKLNRGRVDLDVRPRAAGHDFVVEAPPFSFVVVGTAFSVRRTRHADGFEVSLEVREGRVAVERAGRRIALITHGGSWTGPVEGASAPLAATSPAPAAAVPSLPSPQASPPSMTPSPPSTPDPAPAMRPAPTAAAQPAWMACAKLLDGTNRAQTAEAAQAVNTDVTTAERTRPTSGPRAAIDCYQRVADRGTDLESELAAYEAARLWRDEARDLDRARRAFAAHEARFPKGTLRVEAGLSLLEVLARLGRHEEALAQTDRLLALPDAEPREAEIQLIRGNLLRVARGDCAGALSAYRGARGATGATGDEAAYAEALCLAALGRTEEAVKAFDDYVSRSGARHLAEAQQHRRELLRRRGDGGVHAR